MDKYKKTFLGSITAFILGISCCWMSSLAIWIGGASLVGTILHFVEDLHLNLPTNSSCLKALKCT